MSDDAAIERLRDAGLIVEWRDDEPPKHSGYVVCKPADVRGNSREEGTWWFFCADGTAVMADCPHGMLLQKNGRWSFEVTQFLAGAIPPCPGDYTKAFESLGEAADGVIKYYFGDPSLMNPPEYLKYRATDSFWEFCRDCPVQPGKTCKHEGCNRETMKVSLFCAEHHYEKSVGRPPPYGDTLPPTAYRKPVQKDRFWEHCRDSCIQPDKACQRDGCDDRAMTLSVFCGRHHYEMITGNPPPHGDSPPAE